MIPMDSDWENWTLVYWQDSDGCGWGLAQTCMLGDLSGYFVMNF